MVKIIIGIIGKRRSGKSTAAEYLVNGYSFIKISFATPLKMLCKNLFFLTNEQLEGDSKDVIDNRYGVSPRQLMQTIGNELFKRDIYSRLPQLKIPPGDIWINIFKHTYDVISSKSRNSVLDVVVPDVRFKREVEFLRKLQKNVVILLVKDVSGKEVLIKGVSGEEISMNVNSVDEEVDVHVSENEYKDITPDYVIENDKKDLGSFFNKIDEFIEKKYE